MTYSLIRPIAPLLGAALIATGLAGAAQAEGLFQNRTMSRVEARLAKSFEVLERKEIQLRERIRTQERTQDRTKTQDRARTQDRLRDTTATATQTRSRAALGADAGGSRSGAVSAGGNGASGRN